MGEIIDIIDRTLKDYGIDWILDERGISFRGLMEELELAVEKLDEKKPLVSPFYACGEPKDHKKASDGEKDEWREGSEPINEKLYEYCSEQMDMMFEDLEKDGKLKDSDSTNSKPCVKFKSWKECYHTCIEYPVCRRYYRVMEDVE